MAASFTFWPFAYRYSWVAMASSSAVVVVPGGPTPWRLSPVRRGILSLIVSLAFLYNVPLRLQQAAHVRDIAFPVTDPALLHMADQDLGVWSQQEEKEEDPYHERTIQNEKKKFLVPGPSELYNINPYLSVVHISTKTGISFLNKFEHLRMLWFGCSLHRILQFLISHQIDLDTYIVLNVGDEYVDSERATFPIFSKARLAFGNVNNHPSGGGRDNIMIPYEELLWNYRPLLTTPMHTKTRQVVFRGGCTHALRSEMVHTVRDAFSNADRGGAEQEAVVADVAVGCEANYTLLTPQQQSQARCLLDYDGRSYSRRTAWYLETGSVILRGGVIDDVLSRLARQRKGSSFHPQQEEHQVASSVEDIESSLPPAMVFWNADELVPVVQKCLDDDEWSSQLSEGAIEFWSRYVQQGQSVWDGYLTHLILEQSKRWSLVLDEGYEHPTYSFFSTLSSTMACPLILEGAIPTGDAGELQMGFIVSAATLSLFVIAVTYHIIVPLCCWMIWKWTESHSLSSFLPMTQQRHPSKQPRLIASMNLLVQQRFMAPKSLTRKDSDDSDVFKPLMRSRVE